MDWTGRGPPPALAGGAQSSGSSRVRSEAGRRQGAGQGVAGASGLALGNPVVSRPHMLPLFTEGGCHQQGRGGSVGQNH